MNCARLYVLFLLLGLFSFPVWGQLEKESYSGRLIDAEDNTPLDNVICEGLNGNEQLITYSLSAEDGTFSLEKKNDLHFITFRLLGYERKVIPISNFRGENMWNVKLRRTEFMIKEIVVTVPPIEQQNDTIRYNVGSFLGQEDRYVADVLRKLPGIKVSDNGTVTYQGDAISKFYIEGRDLLGGQYNLATNNLAVDAVSHVEVLENNQHIKALKGVEFSDKAALNIRLKKGYKVRPFGEVQAGIGFSPILYDEKAFATFLGTNVQAMVNLKVNNSGRHILDEIEDKLNTANLFTYEVLPENFLSIRSLQPIPLDLNRYLFNKTYLGNANTLFALSEHTELKINFSYGSEQSDQDLFSRYRYGGGEEMLEINEQSVLNNRIKNFRVAAIIENNSPKKYIKNESVWYGKRENSKYAINADLKDMRSSGENQPVYIQNDFTGLVKYRNNKTLEWQSFLRYSENEEELYVEKEESFDESFNGKYLVSRNRVSSSYNLFNQRMNIGLFFTYKQRDLKNELSHNGWEVIFPKEQHIGNIADKTKWIQVGIAPNYQIRSKNSRNTVTIDLPFAYSKYTHENRTNKRLSDEKILFQPALSGNFRLNHYWEMRTRLGYDYRYADDKSLLSHPFFRSYRAVYIPSGLLNSSRNYNISAGFRYKDITNLLFFNVNILYRLIESNYINSSSNTATYSFRTTEKKNNTGEQLLFTADLSKTFNPFKLSLILTPTYNQLKSELKQQDIYFFNKSHIASLSLKADLKAIPKTTLVYYINGDMVWNENKLSDKNILKSLKQKLSLYYFPDKKIDLLAVCDYSIHELQKNKFDSFFFIDVVGKFKYKKVEMNATISNLFNTQNYSITYLYTINSTCQYLTLRGREFLLLLKFNF